MPITDGEHLPVPSPSRIASIAERGWQIVVGAVLIIAGVGICWAFLALHDRRIEDFWQLGELLAAEAYSLVGSLFILLGLRYVFGPRSWIQRHIGGTLRHLLIALVILSLITLAAYAFILLTNANVA